MKKVVTKLPAGEILRISRLNDGTYEVVQKVPDEEMLTLQEVPGSSKTVIPARLVLRIDAESLSKTDKFLTYQPKTPREEETKERILAAIDAGVKNYYRPVMDPSFTKDDEGIFFKSQSWPAVGKSYRWWEKAAKEYAPERNSRLGTDLEYAAFLGVFIKKLASKCKSIEWAWNVVCNDSRELGHYWNSDASGRHYEPTGSRGSCGFYDLANTTKILACEADTDKFCLAGGNFLNDGWDDPIANITAYNICDKISAFF
jgi:hypothetical protein